MGAGGSKALEPVAWLFKKPDAATGVADASTSDDPWDELTDEQMEALSDEELDALLSASGEDDDEDAGAEDQTTSDDDTAMTPPATSTPRVASTPTPAPKKPKAPKKAKAPKADTRAGTRRGHLGRDRRGQGCARVHRAPRRHGRVIRRQTPRERHHHNPEEAARRTPRAREPQRRPGRGDARGGDEFRGMLPPKAHPRRESRGGGFRRRAAHPRSRHRTQARGGIPGVSSSPSSTSRSSCRRCPRTSSRTWQRRRRRL